MQGGVELRYGSFYLNRKGLMLEIETSIGRCNITPWHVDRILVFEVGTYRGRLREGGIVDLLNIFKSRSSGQFSLLASYLVNKPERDISPIYTTLHIEFMWDGQCKLTVDSQTARITEYGQKVVIDLLEKLCERPSQSLEDFKSFYFQRFDQV